MPDNAHALLIEAIASDNVLSLSCHLSAIVAACDVVDVNERGWIHEAVHSGADDSLQWLIDQHIGSVNHGDSQRETPLMRAAWLGNLIAVSMLLEAGADVKAVALTGATALHYAYENNKTPEKVAAALLAAGADPAATTGNGQTPMQWYERAKQQAERQELLLPGSEKIRQRLSLSRK